MTPLDRCLDLWKHQNSLLWGRLQTISAIQGAVLSGWYLLFTNERFIWAVLLTALGTFLSHEVHSLIRCDLDLRLKFKDEIKKIAPEFFPEHDATPGWKIIMRISKTFVGIQIGLLILSLVFSWLSEGVVRQLFDLFQKHAA